MILHLEVHCILLVTHAIGSPQDTCMNVPVWLSEDSFFPGLDSASQQVPTVFTIAYNYNYTKLRHQLFMYRAISKFAIKV